MEVVVDSVAIESPEPTKVTRPVRKVKKQPWEIFSEENPALQEAMSVLPKNYDFEIAKTVYKIISSEAKLVALQFPEGLMFCGCIISDIITNFTTARLIILADVTYGACCVDDYTADKVGADLLIHYGHSCLIPINQTKIKTMYVFVEIYFDTDHLLSVLKECFAAGSIIAIQGTVQFLRAVQEAKDRCQSHFARIDTPQLRPLSAGETLGCTAPILASDISALVFIADGRFHMEAAMIRNPSVKHCFRYDPYGRSMTRERYDHDTMHSQRRRAITQASSAKVWGVILGTLGRQGNTALHERLMTALRKHNREAIPLLMAEISPAKLRALGRDQNGDGRLVIEAWVQVACPRLAIDWAAAEYSDIGPLLTPFEAMVALDEAAWPQETVYPMDYYSSSEKSPWGNYYTG